MTKKQSEHNKRHAIVIGASMTGLVTARVLSDHFERVTVIERDKLPEQVETRKSVPQGHHTHGLLVKGSDILADLFPGLFEALTRDGAQQLTPVDAKWYHAGTWKTRFPISSIHMYSQSRPFLEQYVRNFLVTRSNVCVVEACEVTRLLATNDSCRVTGVSLRYRNEVQREEELAADLVVDASGRGSRAPQWLVSLGYTQVEETSVKVDIGYASRIYRLPNHFPIDWKMLLIHATPPVEKRAGTLTLIEGNRWIATLGGYGRDNVPNEESFLDYAHSLSQSGLYEAIKEAEPLTPVFTYKFSANRWRHYERMARFPDGLVILGDAVCSFNPMYGQGMTVAALEAQMLDTYVRQPSWGKSGSAQQIQRAVSKLVQWPWQIAINTDRPYLETSTKQTWIVRLLDWYMLQVILLTSSNLLAAERFYWVMHMLKPPITLFDPRIVWTILRQKLASRRKKPAGRQLFRETSITQF